MKTTVMQSFTLEDSAILDSELIYSLIFKCYVTQMVVGMSHFPGKSVVEV